MKHRTNRQRENRKMMKAMGKWPVRQKDEPLFACERVLADAPLAVQDLLSDAMARKVPRNMILNMSRVRQPYTKLSCAKTKKKSVLMHPLVKPGQHKKTGWERRRRVLK